MSAGALRVRLAHETDRPAWDAFVAGRPEADFLQDWAWGEVMAPDGEAPRRLLAEGAAGTIRGLAQALARPAALGRSVWYLPHGPIWEREAPDGDGVLDALLTALGAAARSERAIVVKLDPRGLGGDADRLAAALHGRGLRRARHDLQAPTTRVVDLLEDEAGLQATWHHTARRFVRRSEREGVVIEAHRDVDPTALAEFHSIYAATARRADFRARSAGFLDRLAGAFAPGGRWLLVLARLGGRVIAGIAVPRLGDRAYYLYAASSKEPELRHAYGGYAAMAGAMRELRAGGARTLDLWGVAEEDDPSADPTWRGFSTFKRAFGGMPLRHPGTFDRVIDPAWYALRDLRERLRSG